ncbi:hypothetical protein FACS189415_6160 [Bacteroidia bacterium]|nr:hypothetical protein FACS189415_6160 [Bacteroidia bacterium]
MKVQNKTIVVTGGGNGIGRQIVLNLLAKGAKVVAVDINESALQATMQLAGDNHDKLSTHLLDITNRDAVEAFANQAIERHGTIEGIVNNAGIMQPFVKVNDLDYTHIEKVINVNFYGVLYMTKAFLPHLLQRPEASIVNVSSMGGLLPVPGECIYGATKAAVTLLTEGLHSELRNTNVKMTLVCPGAMATDIKFHSGADNKQFT